jgi:hypothetical protein
MASARCRNPDDRSWHFSDVVSLTDIANYGEIAVPTISAHTKESEANASGLCNTDARRPSQMLAVV